MGCVSSQTGPGVSSFYVFFFAAAALALAAFFLLLRIMTTPRKEPTTAEARRMRMTGMRTAQTRGGKKFWRGWSESTKGWEVVLVTRWSNLSESSGVQLFIYHEQGPEGVVEEDDRGGHKHGDAHEFVKLRTWEGDGLAHASRLGERMSDGTNHCRRPKEPVGLK